MKQCIEVDEFLIYLRGSIKQMQKLFNAELKKYGISSSHLVFIMLLIRHQEGLTMTELSHMSQVDKALTSRVIKELENKRYVYRDINDNYARNYDIHLTEIGKNMALIIQKNLSKNKKEFFKKFSQEEQKQIFDVMVMLKNKFNNQKEE